MNKIVGFTPKMVKSVLKTRVSEIRVDQIHVIQNLFSSSSEFYILFDLLFQS